MRLLQLEESGSLSLVEFIGDSVPPYAILSHTWSQTSKEVAHAALESGDYKSKSDYERSYDKIRLCGNQARKDGLKHFWVDICCISKKSSAELSDAINSMLCGIGTLTSATLTSTAYMTRTNFREAADLSEAGRSKN